MMFNASLRDQCYFSHDSRAHRHPKMVTLINEVGFDAYGHFWIIVEKLREQDAYKYPFRFLSALAVELRMNLIQLNAFLAKCVELELFKKDETHFWSDSLLERMRLKDEKSEKAKQSADRRWKKADASALQTHSDGNAIAMQPQCYKEKEIKENKNKAKESYLGFENIKLFPEEYTQLIETYGQPNTTKLLKKLSSYKFSHGKEYKSDFAAIEDWVVKAEKIFPINTTPKISTDDYLQQLGGVSK